MSASSKKSARKKVSPEGTKFSKLDPKFSVFEYDEDDDDFMRNTFKKAFRKTAQQQSSKLCADESKRTLGIQSSVKTISKRNSKPPKPVDKRGYEDENNHRLSDPVSSLRSTKGVLPVRILSNNRVGDISISGDASHGLCRRSPITRSKSPSILKERASFLNSSLASKFQSALPTVDLTSDEDIDDIGHLNSSLHKCRKPSQEAVENGVCHTELPDSKCSRRSDSLSPRTTSCITNDMEVVLHGCFKHGHALVTFSPEWIKLEIHGNSWTCPVDKISFLRLHKRNMLGNPTLALGTVLSHPNFMKDLFVEGAFQCEISKGIRSDELRKIIAMSDKYKGLLTEKEADVLDIDEGRVNLQGEGDSISGRQQDAELSMEVSMANVLALSRESPLIFPDGDQDAVTITTQDIEMLRPAEFLNDTIIDFYIKHLQSKLSPEKRKQCYFFNSFFFRKLLESYKFANDIDHGQIMYERVRKWTRGVDLFEKDYIFIPVNKSLHWSLLIICFPIKSISSLEDNESFSNGACVMHLDSLRGSHGSLDRYILSYLQEAWKERGDLHKVFHPIKLISADVPQQQNPYDCGLFLLHYVELFITFINFGGEERPLDFIKKDFAPKAVSTKRQTILELIFELYGKKKQLNDVHGISNAGDYEESPLLSSNSSIVEVSPG